MKALIIKEYIKAVYDDIAPNVFADTILALFNKGKKETRTDLQSRSRWKYLTMVASTLNEMGFTYNPMGTDLEVLWTKDLLYVIYWETTRKTMYPQKRKQLNTKEFCDLADMVMNLFAKIFEITIPFPDKSQLIKREEPNK